MNAKTHAVRCFIDDIQLTDVGGGEQLEPGETLLIAHVHLFHSTVHMINHLIELGFQAASIVVIPKPYSTIPSALQDMLDTGCRVVQHEDTDFYIGRYDEAISLIIEQACEVAVRLQVREGYRRCVLLDDGGQLAKVWSNRFLQTGIQTVAVQHTTSGLTMSGKKLLPTINVAGSKAKRVFEADYISSGIVSKIESLKILKEGEVVSVIGLGAIGKALSARLSGICQVYGFDVDEGIDCNHSVQRASLETCLSKGSLIFGCTGVDFLSHYLSLLDGLKHKHLISTSSRDVEFKTLLSLKNAVFSYGDLFGTVTVQADTCGPFFIHNGGFPINFDRQTEWEQEEEIGLTRGLMILGILQALRTEVKVGHLGNMHQLNVNAQQKLVSNWLEVTQKDIRLFGVSQESLDDLSWWESAS